MSCSLDYIGPDFEVVLAASQADLESCNFYMVFGGRKKSMPCISFIQVLIDKNKKVEIKEIVFERFNQEDLFGKRFHFVRISKREHEGAIHVVAGGLHAMYYVKFDPEEEKDPILSLKNVKVEGAKSEF